MRFSICSWNIFTPPSQPYQGNLQQPLPCLEHQVAERCWKMLAVLMSGRYRHRDLGKEMSTPARVSSQNGPLLMNGPEIQDQLWHFWFSGLFMIFLQFSALERFAGEAMLASTQGWYSLQVFTCACHRKRLGDHKPPHLTFDTFWPIFKASWSQAFWESVASICWIGRSWASHPRKPPSRIITRCLDGQLFRKKLATLLLWFSPAESVAFEGLW